MTAIPGTRKILAVTAVAGLSLLAGPLAPAETHAAVSLCRTDPIAWLNTGVKVQLAVSFQLQPSNVQSIHYALQIPAGTSVSKIVYTQGRVGLLESTSVYADDTAGTYDSSTIVYSAMNRVPVNVTERVVNPNIGASTASSAAGQTNQYVLNHVHQ